MVRLRFVKISYSILAAILIALGLWLMIRPETAFSWFTKTGGIVLVIFGIVKLFGYFSRDLFQLAFQFDLAMGLISMILGTFMLVRTDSTMVAVALILALFLLADAALKLQTALDAKHFGIERWWLILMISIVDMAIGFWLLFAPINGAIVIMQLVGLNICINGVLNLIVVHDTVSTYRRRERWQD